MVGHKVSNTDKAVESNRKGTKKPYFLPIQERKNSSLMYLRKDHTRRSRVSQPKPEAE